VSRVNRNIIALCLLILCAVLATRIGVPIQARAQTQRRNNPTVRETLRWMQTSLDAGGGDYSVGHETRSVRLEDFVGCKVHFSYSTHQEPYMNGEPAPEPNKTYHVDYFFGLGDIDPNNITFLKGSGLHAGDDGLYESPSFLTIRTRNDEKKITSRYSWQSEVNDKPDDIYVMFTVDSIDNDYVGTFAKAFKHAVEACGGKPSFFAESDGRDRDERAPLAAGGVAAQSAPPRKAKQDPWAVVSQTPVVAAPPRTGIPAIAKAADGAIVSIIMSNGGNPLAQGSGFLISRDGLIVTNYHVIANGDSAVVKLPDDSVYPIEGVLAADKVRDVAVIKARGENFRTVTMGNSDRLQVGEEVIAIGSPLFLESTVSNGILSGIRSIPEEGGKLLQITAPISHGSSGGPLFNMAGEVVGITTLYLKGGENLNFAIPINDAKRLLLNQTAKLQNLPNEKNAEETPKETHNATSTSPREIPREPVPNTPVDTSITKIAASSPDIPHATPTQFWSDIQYCYRNPANNLRFSTGVVSCRDIITIMEEEERDCRSMGKKAPDGKDCKTFLKNYKAFKEGRISIP
jgi:hypothetical protein